ncbi:MAG: rod shape-determining protein MreD [Acidimicrobiales bacterium]|nr:rod shape-determining protein MreD [Acidimicrobiales bacterium]
MKSMNLASSFKMVFVLLVAVIIQDCFIDVIKIQNVHGDIFPLIVFCTAVVAGSELGIIIGFVAGLGADLLQPTPFGITALVLVFLGYGIGEIFNSSSKYSWFALGGGLSLACVFSEVVWALLGDLLGVSDILNGRLISIVAVTVAINLLLLIPFMRLISWSLTGTSFPWGGTRSKRRRPVTVGLAERSDANA